MTGAVRARGLVVLGLAAAVGLTGCSGSSEATVDDHGGTSSQATAAGAALSAGWPLTGLPVHGPRPRHPVMVVKIDNSSSSAPQVGLSGADLVTEELVEGGSTRLAVFFYQHTPALVGPVRSMRATDIGIVKPAGAVLVASGGAPPTVRRIAAAHITTYTEGATGYQRDAGRTAPYNLFMHLDKLAATLRARTPAPAYLPFGPARDLPRGRPAAGLSAVFSGGHTTSWTYAGGRYTNQNGFAAAGDRFSPDTVLVLRVRVGDAGYRDPAGNPVPETRLTGTGRALVFHGGRVVHATWRKALSTTVTLRTRKGGRLSVPAGHTWIELVPSNGGRVIVG